MGAHFAQFVWTGFFSFFALHLDCYVQYPVGIELTRACLDVCNFRPNVIWNSQIILLAKFSYLELFRLSQNWMPFRVVLNLWLLANNNINSDPMNGTFSLRGITQERVVWLKKIDDVDSETRTSCRRGPFVPFKGLSHIRHFPLAMCPLLIYGKNIDKTIN